MIDIGEPKHRIKIYSLVIQRGLIGRRAYKYIIEYLSQGFLRAHHTGRLVFNPQQPLFTIIDRYWLILKKIYCSIKQDFEKP